MAAPGVPAHSLAAWIRSRLAAMNSLKGGGFVVVCFAKGSKRLRRYGNEDPDRYATKQEAEAVAQQARDDGFEGVAVLPGSRSRMKLVGKKP